MIQRLIMQRTRLLAISIGIVYLWFGVLKFFPGVSPAETLAQQTLDKLVFGLFPSHVSYFMLALWEVTIGMFMLLKVTKKWIIQITILHLLLTFTPLILLPEASFNQHFYSLTLVGQYIIKNLILLAAILFLLEETPNKKHQVL